MEWKFDESRSIWQQIREQLTKRILSGEFLPGDKLPSVREMATEAGVNPNTMQRALLSLDETGLTTADRTKGRIVTADSSSIDRERDKLARGHAAEYLMQTRALGIEDKDAANILNEVAKNE